MVDGLASGLLGRHVLGRAGHHARLGHRGVIDRAGQPEVGDFHPLHAVLQEQVRGFDVAMNQPLGVRRRKSAGRLRTDAEDLAQFGGLVAIDHILDRFAGNVLHHKVRNALRRDLDCIDCDNVLMNHRGRCLGLAGKPPPRCTGRRHARRQHLDRHQPLERAIACLEDHPHAAPADHTQDVIRAKPAQKARLIDGFQQTKRDYLVLIMNHARGLNQVLRRWVQIVVAQGEGASRGRSVRPGRRASGDSPGIVRDERSGACSSTGRSSASKRPSRSVW